MKLKFLVPFVIFFSLLSFIPSPCFAQLAPLPPKDLVAEVKNGDSVNLAWTPPVDTSIAGFNIYRKEDVAMAAYEKINSKVIADSNYNDKGAKKGTSYVYMCRSVNIDGIESPDSNAAGAPKMFMDASATVTHMGRTVRIAAPGDVIKYSIDFANRGFGIARNVVIVYAIPKGTTFISGTARCPKYKITIAYFDEKSKKWVSRVSREENVSKVRFTLLEDVHPVEKNKDKNDTASLKVMVNY